MDPQYWRVCVYFCLVIDQTSWIGKDSGWYRNGSLLVTWRVVSSPPRRRVEDTSGLCSGLPSSLGSLVRLSRYRTVGGLSTYISASTCLILDFFFLDFLLDFILYPYIKRGVRPRTLPQFLPHSGTKSECNSHEGRLDHF